MAARIETFENAQQACGAGDDDFRAAGTNAGVLAAAVEIQSGERRYNWRTCTVDARTRSASSRLERGHLVDGANDGSGGGDVAMTRSQLSTKTPTVCPAFRRRRPSIGESARSGRIGGRKVPLQADRAQGFDTASINWPSSLEIISALASADIDDQHAASRVRPTGEHAAWIRRASSRPVDDFDRDT